MNKLTACLRSGLFSLVLLSPCGSAFSAGGNTIEAINVDQQGGLLVVKIGLSNPVNGTPNGFVTATPPRIALDFLDTSNGLGKNSQAVNMGALRNVNVVDRKSVV